MRTGTGTGTTFLLLPSVLFCLFVCQLTVKAQSLPPAKYDGFVYTNNLVDSHTIMIEAFYDPVCPDSRDSWPPLKQAIQHYGSRVSLTVHLLPLPYHDYAFATSRALHIVNLVNPSATFRLLDCFFEHQERFYNAQTSNMSKDAVVDEIIKFTTKTVGNSYYSAIASGFNDSKTDLKTRVSFKITRRGEASSIHCLSHRAKRYRILHTYFDEGFSFPVHRIFFKGYLSTVHKALHQ
ncbi:hypothetical protein DITRI_Ditri03aG0219100 [Diplodiscus trichospermus]